MSPEEIQKLQEENKALKKIQEENKALKSHAEALERSIAEASAKGGPIALPVPGTFTVNLETPGGKAVKRKIRFKPGRIKCALRNGMVVSSAAIMQLANGKKLDSKVVEKFPALRGLDKDAAIKYLTYLAQIKAGTIEDAK